MTTEKYLPYRGELRAIVAAGGTLAFVTAHAEGQATPAFRLDADKLTLAGNGLPCGGVALALDGDTFWVAGTDRRIYQASVQGGPPTARGLPYEAPITALAILSESRLAIVAGHAVYVMTRADGKTEQVLPLPEAGTCAAADPTGRWLVVGTVRGTVVVFEAETQPEFQPSDNQRLHEGAVTALAFEPEELRFLSAGADQQLLSTHARGTLEPEDRGRGNNHSDLVTRIIWGPGDRFLTGSRDKSVKSWPRVGHGRPVTLKDGVVAVVDIAIITIHNRPQLAVACDDNSIRFFKFDEAGKFDEPIARIYDALAGARNELSQPDATRREATLVTLGRYADTASIELISEQVGKDDDHALRLRAVELLGQCTHARAGRLLERWLGHDDEAVRVAAFHGLRKHTGEVDLRAIDLALKADKPDVGQLAVQALEKLAGKDEQAHARLVRAVDHKAGAVRHAAMLALGKVHGDSPEGWLLALRSKHADVRRKSLVRLFRRGLLKDARVQTALRQRTEDEDAEVRRIAFLLVLHPRERLLQALRERDPELKRQLKELAAKEKGDKDEREESNLPAKVSVPAGPVEGLDDADVAPVLQATASRAVDTCLRGARALAMIGDPRAFGLLLQLSREEAASSRVEVCRALAALDDPRSISRLRSLLYDTDATVRDAAFTALAGVHVDDPLLAAEAGLSAAFEDVRRRGLQALAAELRKTPPSSSNDRSWQLLTRALNDNFAGVRSEAFKTALNLQIAGGGVHTLRFALESIHADVRREVLTEVMAQATESWAWNLLLEFFNDHDAKVRGEAFEFAAKKSKELEPLQAALRSQFADVRKRAVDALVKKHSDAAQAILVAAVNDGDREVRHAALSALVSANAREPLAQTLASTHVDVRVQAARALARHGDAACLEPLLALATAPEPTERERVLDWSSAVESALDGLGTLADMSALPHIAPLIHSPHANIRRAAAAALVWVALPNHTETLRQALQHSDAQVKYRAALGLAFAGDTSVAALIFSDTAKPVLTPHERLAAAFVLGDAGAEAMSVLLDDDNADLRSHAKLLLQLRDTRRPTGVPSNCIACLSSRHVAVRLGGAVSLMFFHDPAVFTDAVRKKFGPDGVEWDVPLDVVQDYAEMLVHGSPLLRARSALLVQHRVGKDQAGWDQAWAAHPERYRAELLQLREAAAQREPKPSAYSDAQLRQLAFGVFLGMARDATPGSPIAVARRMGLTWLHWLQKEHWLGKEHDLVPALTPIYVQALGDPNQEVRTTAFDQLMDLGIDRTTLGAEALETGHLDLGVRGLELLAGDTSAAEGQAVLENAMRTRKDDLALEAAKLLVPRRGAVAVAGRALDAATENVRGWAVESLSAAADKDENARAMLRQALGSRHSKVRESAAAALAARKDPAAFDALVKLLEAATEPGRQRRAIEAIVRLGDLRTPDALLDRLEKDPAGTAQAEELITAAGSFRNPQTADRLLILYEKPQPVREAAFAALLQISGFDQDIEDDDDEHADKSWETKQHPRHPAVLARLMERCFDLGETEHLQQTISAARWARSGEADPILALLTQQPQEELRQPALEALGWRIRKRNASPEPLVKALAQKDPVAQFLAAEALARAGRGDGVNVLLAAVDFMDDFGLRERAMFALGELGDDRATDLLFRLAADDTHALQEAAAEGLGMLGRRTHGDEVLRILERLARGTSERALRGLRWLNHSDGWTLIRRRAAEPHYLWRSTAIEMLGFNDDPTTRDLLQKLLSKQAEDGEALEAALEAARQLWGPESLEPDYALVQFPDGDMDYLIQDSVQRVCERGDARRILEIVPRCQVWVQEELTTSLLNRPTVPVVEARMALGNADERTAALAARLLARANDRSPETITALTATITRWRNAWEERRKKPSRTGGVDPHLAERTTPCLEALFWAAGRLGAASDVVAATITARPDDPHFRAVRRAAVFAVAGGSLTAATVKALEAVVTGDDPETRVVAADALARHEASRAASLAERALADRLSFNRLAARRPGEVAAALHAAAGRVHYQGVALPHLVTRGDVDALAEVAQDRSLPMATRMGAIEGLGKLGQETAEERIVALAQAADDDEEVRKCAWRALRRSRRARQKVEEKGGVA
jgi:ParB family chromosome partitioning protein